MDKEMIEKAEAMVMAQRTMKRRIKDLVGSIKHKIFYSKFFYVDRRNLMLEVESIFMDNEA